MGNFHCIPSDCATVHWREYLSPSVRYRYSGEDWVYIEGADDFKIERPLGQCDTAYRVTGRSPTNGLANCGVSWQIDPTPAYPWTINTTGRVIGLEYVETETRTEYASYPNGRCNTSEIIGETPFCFAYLKWEGQTDISKGGLSYFYGTWIEEFENDNPQTMHQIDSIERIDGLPDDCGTCVLTIYKDEKIILEKGHAQCPEVEILPCRLSEVNKELKIEKQPFLERIEVIPYAYQNFGINLFRKDIPDECLNILKNTVAQIVPLPGGIPTPHNGPIDQDFTYGFVQQICSHPGCPPPEYTVVCDCCEECPDGTCAVECGDHICCYNTLTGKAVQQIDKNNYCGDEN